MQHNGELEMERSRGTESEPSPGQVPFQQNSAGESQDKLCCKQRRDSEEPTPFHPPATQRRNEQTGCAGQKPCADKVQPLHGKEKTDSGKKAKAAEEEERQNNAEYLPVNGLRRVITPGEERSVLQQPQPG